MATRTTNSRNTPVWPGATTAILAITAISAVALARSPSGEIRRFTIEGRYNTIRHVTFSSDGSLVFACTAHVIRWWNTQSGQVVHEIRNEDQNFVDSVVLAPDGHSVTIGARGEVFALDVRTGVEIRRFPQNIGITRAMAFSPNGRYLVVAEGSIVGLWDAETGKQLARLRGHEDGINSIAVARDNRHALTASGDHSIKYVKSPATGREEQQIVFYTDNTIRLWDLWKGREVRRFEGHTAQVQCLIVAPDEQTAISGGWDRSIRFWDVASGKELRRIEEAGGVVTALALSPDGRYLLSGSGKMDNNDPAPNGMRLWEVASGKEMARFENRTEGRFSHATASVAFSPDGRLGVSGDEDGIIRLWALSVEGSPPTTQSIK